MMVSFLVVSLRWSLNCEGCVDWGVELEIG